MEIHSIQFNRWTAAIVLFAFLSHAAMWHPLSVYAQTPLESRDPTGAILLKTDRVLEGTITFSGDKYTVALAQGSNVSIPKADVLFVGQTKRDAYDFKVRNIARWSTGDHFKLTRWCILHDMTKEAVEHYTVVAKDARDHPRVKQLANELKQHLLRQPEFRDYLGISGESETLVTEVHSDKTIGSRAAHNPTRRVGYEGNSIWADLPPMAITDFTNHIQPIFINRCSQSACHGASTTTKFKVVEPYGQSAPETTAANIANVRRFLNRKPNSEIPEILDFATRAHGIQRQPGISIAENDVLMSLRRWIEFVENPVVAADGTSMNNGSITVEAGYLSPTAPQKLTPVEPASANQLKSVPRQVSIASPSTNASEGAGNISSSSPPTMSDLDELDARIRLAEGNAGSPLIVEPRTNRRFPTDNGTLPSPDTSRMDPFAPDDFNRQRPNQP